jgi:cell division protein FtsB
VRPRDITGRVLSKPLQSPYAQSANSLLGNRWLWAGFFLWLLWMSVISDHSLLNIMRMRHQLASMNTDIARVRTEAHQLEEQLNDPQARRDHAEAMLRQQGMLRPGEIQYRLGGAATDSTRR